MFAIAEKDQYAPSLLANSNYLPLGVIKTTMYTKTQFPTIAIEFPTLRMRDELISEG